MDVLQLQYIYEFDTIITKLFFINRSFFNSLALSKFIWTLKGQNVDYKS